MQIQIIDYDSFSRRQIVLPHILPHIKIRVIECLSWPVNSPKKSVGFTLMSKCKDSLVALNS